MAKNFQIIKSKNSILIVLLAFFLHQSNRTSLGNLSISDMLIIFYIINLILNNKLALSKKIIMSFFILSAYGLSISLFYTPQILNVYARTSIISNYLKYCALFLFFISGYNVSSKENIDLFIKYYSYSAALIGLIGIILSIFSISFLNEIFFKYGNRFNGFMNDPNYFAILQISALPFFFNKQYISLSLRLANILIITLSVLISGSKTGMLILIIYIFYKLFFFLYICFNSKKKLLVWSLIISLICVSIFLIDVSFVSLLDSLNSFLPVTSRITALFQDFESQLSAGGSTRNVAWSIGWEMVNLSPFFGVGLVGYSVVSNQYFRVGLLPHNTYLQLAAEWGILISVIFYLYLSYLLFIAAVIEKKHRNFPNDLYISTVIDILIIFLLGSMGISLNNARMFWIIIGALVSIIFKYKTNRVTIT